MKSFICTFILHFLFILCLNAATINVPADTTSIQGGISMAINGDTVLVNPGQYVENIDFNGKSIIVASLFLTTEDSSFIESTMIDANYSGRPVTFQTGEDSLSVIFGFTIMHGGSEKGGGIYCFNTSPKITNNIISGHADFGGGICCEKSEAIIINNTIKNSGNKYGGGIACIDSSNVLIVHNIIESNGSENGGGIYVENSSVFIENNDIIYNSCDGWQPTAGGGIYCSNSKIYVENNRINYNYGPDSGGGLYIRLSEAEILNNEIIVNSALGGGGIVCTGPSEVLIKSNLISKNSCTAIAYGGGISSSGNTRIYNNLITENSADKGGGVSLTGSNSVLINNTISGNIADYGAGVYFLSNGHTVKNNIFWQDSSSSGVINEISFLSGNSPITYCNIEGGWQGEGNINLDPLFRDSKNGDYHLMSISCGYSDNSPCIDAGDTTITDSLLDCSWGLGSSRSDIGAYGGGYLYPTKINNEPSNNPNYFSLSQNYPNPFNPITYINYGISKPCIAELSIFNLLGQKLVTLISSKHQIGNYTIKWNASDFSSGVYIYRLKTNTRFEKTKKMILMK